MAIYCSQCGKELPDDANFCMKCGKALTAVVQAVTSQEPRWEYCEVVYNLKPNGRSKSDFPFGRTYYFDIVMWAKGIGPHGAFNATEGKSFTCRTVPHDHPSNPPSSRFYYPESGTSEDIEAVNKIVSYLTTEGWEPLPNKGSEWYSYKFRRKVG